MNAYFAVLCTALCLFLSCGQNDPREVRATSSTELSLQHGAKSFDANAAVSSSKLREYCRACHAIGNLRFIYDDDDQNLWNHILTTNVPGNTELWADAIVRVLSWPTDIAPAPSPVMDPPSGRDWMPKGSKRLHFAADKIDGVAVRHFVLDAIAEELSR